jgi:hypothetical protein
MQMTFHFRTSIFGIKRGLALLTAVVICSAASAANAMTCKNGLPVGVDLNSAMYAGHPDWVASDREMFARHCREWEALMAKHAKIRACYANIPKLRIGMSDTEVVALICKPDHINTTVTPTYRREQWVYSGDFLYFEDGRLVALQFISR